MRDYIGRDFNLLPIPPLADLPEELRELATARDDAYDAYDTAAIESEQMLARDWEKRAADADRAAARKAVAEGRDPLKVKSTLDAWRTARPKVAGQLDALAANLRAADKTLRAAVLPWIGSLAPAYGRRVAEAESAYREALEAVKRAEGDLATAIAHRMFVHQTATGQEPMHFPGRKSELRNAHGGASDFRGKLALNDILASYQRAGVDLKPETADGYRPARVELVRNDGMRIQNSPEAAAHTLRGANSRFTFTLANPADAAFIPGLPEPEGDK